MTAIKVNGKIYETFTDAEGVLRFKPNNLISKMRINFDLKISEIIKLVELESISLMDLLDYYTGIGTTVCGVKELGFFEELDFEEISNDDDFQKEVLQAVISSKPLKSRNGCGVDYNNPEPVPEPTFDIEKQATIIGLANQMFGHPNKKEYPLTRVKANLKHQSKPFIVANVREIIDLYDIEEVSYSKMVELLNEIAFEFFKQQEQKPTIDGEKEPTEQVPESCIYGYENKTTCPSSFLEECQKCRKIHKDICSPKEKLSELNILGKLNEVGLTAKVIVAIGEYHSQFQNKKVYTEAEINTKASEYFMQLPTGENIGLNTVRRAFIAGAKLTNKN